MSNDQPSRREPGKSGGGAAMGSTVAIVIAVVAVVVGFLVLRNISDSDAGGGTTDPGTENSSGTTPTVDSTGAIVDPTSTVAETTPTTPTSVFDAAQQVIVANAAGIGGAAGNYTKALETAGWTMGTPVDASTQLDVSVVYYLAGGEAVAASVAAAMSDTTGTITASAMPTPPPIVGATAMPAGATVLVMLAKDRAGKALPANAGTTTNTTIVQAPVDSTTKTTTG